MPSIKDQTEQKTKENVSSCYPLVYFRYRTICSEKIKPGCQKMNLYHV